MTTSTNLDAYTDCIELFDRAIASTKGIRLPFTDSGRARHLIVRLNTTRSLIRNKNRQIYAPEDPLYAATPYDTLTVRQPRKIDSTWWVYIEPRMAEYGEIEVLGDEEDEAQAAE